MEADKLVKRWMTICFLNKDPICAEKCYKWDIEANRSSFTLLMYVWQTSISSSSSSSLQGVQLNELNKFVKQGFVEEGPRGELAARFLRKWFPEGNKWRSK